MRTATALWAKLRVARAAIAILASHLTQLRRPTSVPIVSLHSHALSARERVQPVKDAVSSPGMAYLRFLWAWHGSAMPLRVQFKVSPLLTALGGRTGAVAKFDGSGPVRLCRNATISRISSSVSILPNCTRAITFTASSNVATDPSWKYGGVIATLRRLGTWKTERSAGSLVSPKRPWSISWLP